MNKIVAGWYSVFYVEIKLLKCVVTHLSNATRFSLKFLVMSYVDDVMVALFFFFIPSYIVRCFVKLLKLYSDVLSVLISASCGLFACVMQKEKVSHSSIFRCCFRFVLY